jgi:serine/threonine protein kinase
MVSERHPRTVSQLLEEEIISREETVVQTGFLVMEACEVIMGLHSEGLVLGCLGLDCFCLDRFGHCLLDLNQALALCRGVKAGLSSNSIRAFMAPEVAVVLGDTLRTKDRDFDCLVGCSSDIWSLGCVFVALLTRDEQLVASWNSEGLYDDWEKEVVTRLDASLLGTILEPLSAVISSCLRYDPKCRPEIADVWKCIRGLLTKSDDVTLAPDDEVAAQKSFRCLLLGELSSMFVDSGAVESDDKTQLPRGADDNSLNQDHESNDDFLNNRGNDLSGIDGPQSAGVFKSSTLLAHRDCVTGLAIGGKNQTLLMAIFKTFAILLFGFFCSHSFVMLAQELPIFILSFTAGGFLFSSSYDKTINVWSLQV